MRKILLSALGAVAVATFSSGATIAPAQAHHPNTMWYQGNQYWAVQVYDKRWCFYHHGYVYCRRPGSGY
jgi:hypothetical protein